MGGSLIVFGFIVVLVAALCSVQVNRALREARASVTWPTAEGRIVESELSFELVKSAHSRYRLYKAHVVYEYSIGSHTYRCDRVGFSKDDVATPQSVQRIVNRYPTGARVTVYCDSRNPQAAVLDRGADAVRKARIIAIAMGLIGLGLALLGGFLAGL
jgi:hypothetical protein